jgi:hypothetical protein
VYREEASHRRLAVDGAHVEHVEHDVIRPRSHERPRQPSGACVELRLGDEVPRPRILTTCRSSSRIVSAWRTTMRLTPYWRASCGSDGSESPGRQVPDSICSLSSSCSW